MTAIFRSARRSNIKFQIWFLTVVARNFDLKLSIDAFFCSWDSDVRGGRGETGRHGIASEGGPPDTTGREC